MSQRIIANQIQLPSGRIIRSYHRHDYNSVTENGKYYAVDGGEEYLRRAYDKDDFVEASIYDDAPFPVIRKYLVWGTTDSEGNRKWLTLEQMETSHIEAVIELPYVASWRKDFMREELKRRTKGEVECKS